MSMSRTLVLLLILASPLLSAEAPAIDVTLVPGDSFAGAIAAPGDEDAALLHGVAGQLLKFSVTPAKGSALLPRLDLLDADALDQVATSQPKGKGAALEAVLPATRAYLLVVTGLDGTTGGYKVKSKGTLPKAALNPPSEPGGAPGSVEVFIDALAGSLLSATIQPAKGSAAVIDVVALGGPAGEVPLDAYLAPKGAGVQLKNAPLADFGEYVLLVSASGDPHGEILVSTKVKPPKAKVHALVESRFAIVLDPSIPPVGTSSGKKLPIFGQLIDLSGEGLPGTLDWASDGGGKAAAGSFKVKHGAFTGAIKLGAGDNRIVLSANGGQGEVVLDCTCNPGFEFGGLLVVTPDMVFAGETTQMTAQIAILDPHVDANNVWLMTWNAGDTASLFPMTDDGDLGHGDEIQGDRVYTGRASLPWLAPGLVQLRVFASRTDGGGDAWSERFDLVVSQHLTDGELADMLAQQAALQAEIDAAVISGLLPEVLSDIKAALEADPDVAEVGYSESGLGLWMVYDNGVPAVLYSPLADGKGGGGTAAPQLAPQVAPERAARAAAWDAASKPAIPAYGAWLRPAASEPDLPAGALAAKPANSVQSNRAKLIAAQYFDWGENDDIPVMAQKLEDDGCFEVTYRKFTSAGSGSVEEFKNLGQYGLVFISSHGDSFFRGLPGLWEDQFGWNGPLGIVIVDSNMAVTPANKAAYETDLKKGRLVLWYGTYGMTPNFIKRYTGPMPNSLVYMSICRGTWNGTLAAAFLGQGAGAFLGYSDYVKVSFTKAHGPPLLDVLLEDDKTMADAFTPGQKETDADPAEFMLFGAGDLALDPERLNDGGFESAAIGQGWLPAGDARIVPWLGEFGPTEGAFMGIISTGLGFTTSSGSISQTFCLGAGAQAIVFDWNFISEEFVEYCGSIYQDFFIVSIENLDTGGSAQLFATWVDALCGDVFPVGFSFDQGDAHATGWNHANLPLPEGFGGSQVRLTFAASDVGDSIYDTAILLDDIRVVE